MLGFENEELVELTPRLETVATQSATFSVTVTAAAHVGTAIVVGNSGAG